MRRVTFVDAIPFLALIGIFLLGLYGNEQGGGGEFYLLIAMIAGTVMILGWLGLRFRDFLVDVWEDLQALRVRRARARLPEPDTLEVTAALAALQRRDDRTAAAILWLAAEQGDGQAQYVLSTLFRRGRGVPQCREEALKWLARAARHGLVDAVADLGAVYLEPGRERNVMEGIKWLETAARQGSHAAQVRLGDVYANGLDVERNFDRAARWYRPAAEKGSVAAQSALGRLYLHGRGVPKDPVQAFAWLRLAAEQGDRQARHDLNRAGARLSAVDRGESEWLVSEWRGKLSEGARRAAKRKRKAEQKRLDRERGRIIALSVVDQIRTALASVGAESQAASPDGAAAPQPAKSAASDATAAADTAAPETPRRTGRERPDRRNRNAADATPPAAAKRSDAALDDALEAQAAAQRDTARSRPDRSPRRAAPDDSSETRRQAARERISRLASGDRSDVPSRAADPAPEPRRRPVSPGSREDEVVLSDAATRAPAGETAGAEETGGDPVSPARQRLNAMARRGSHLANRIGQENQTAADGGAAESLTVPQIGDRTRRGGNGLSQRDRSALVAERLANLPQAKEETKA